MKALRFGIVAFLLLAGLTLANPVPAESSEQQLLIDQARVSLEAMSLDESLSVMHKLIKRAKGIVVVPDLIKAGFIIGGAGGTGVILAHDVAQNEWTHPAFINLGAASFGLQIGIQIADLVLVVMTAQGLNALISTQVTLGAEAGLTYGTIGGERETAMTTNIDADIYAFSKSMGLFGGISVEGAVISADQAMNAAYYGAPATTREIIIERKFDNPGADGLRQMLADLSS